MRGWRPWAGCRRRWGGERKVRRGGEERESDVSISSSCLLFPPLIVRVHLACQFTARCVLQVPRQAKQEACAWGGVAACVRGERRVLEVRQDGQAGAAAGAALLAATLNQVRSHTLLARPPTWCHQRMSGAETTH